MKNIALTFDDGPWEPTTPHVIDVLTKHHIPATFMIWGQHAQKYPDLLKREAQNPLFAFGNHTYDHLHLPNVSLSEAQDQLDKNDHLIKSIIGREPEYIRPPYGEFNDELLAIFDRPAVIWSLDTKSWDHHDPKKVIQNIHKAKDGDVILMHDFQPADSSAIEDILKTLHSLDFKCCSLKELIGQQQIKHTKVIYSRDKTITK
ncbi:polysaccharide deacetylase family protein [Levilactobacillus namurensis]|uniref:polysaccharide deacetylase family protein n=1 Tax=Levilactobacillus namurensis TaxID=380393 RepID=UPI0022327F05|nr:polysaccharide deacetylase family protein [Levilactobacillus namurensis]MDT7019539.1 polysaccharide deacetylase family protein [Levilactobacillus namurensis]WNN65871.1 polysaccharide deacetylase family protein [Levilactobacillus namurensis]